MFKNNKKQFVNILKQNKQLKLDYKTYQDNKIIKQEQSSFLITDDTIPQDALFRLDTLQKSIPNTYLVSLFEGENQKIIPTQKVDVIGYESVKLDETLSIVVPKNELITASRYFSTAGIDYIVSPLTLLNEYIQDKSEKNSLNVLIYNNVVYIIILNNLRQIAFTKVKELTEFEDVQDVAFSEDEIVGQKLYEEVRFLEIQQFLDDIVKEYYGLYEGTDFLERVELLYTLMPLSEEQIQSLYETVMVKINYGVINIEEYLDTIILKENSALDSFINPRVKKQSGNIYVWILLALISIMVVVTVLYFMLEENKIEKELHKNIKKIERKASEVIKKEIVPMEEEMKKEIVVKLPNHITSNNHILQNIYMLFDVVPYDGVLKDMEITQNSSTYVCNFIANTTSLEDMQTKLLNIYKESKILLKHQNNAIVNSIVENTTLVDHKIVAQKKQYEKSVFLSTSEATQLLQEMLPLKSEIKYIKKEKAEYLQYHFTLKSQVKNTKEFFTLIEKINQQNISIELTYPLTFSKTTDALEIKYNLIVNQLNKKSVEPKK